MRLLSALAAAVLLLSFTPGTVLAQAGSGTLWEVETRMEGMPEGMGFAMPKRRNCTSNNPEAAPPADEGCTVLEQRSKGNHHFAKMKCREGIMELDQTRTRTRMETRMKMTAASGEVSVMLMTGTVVGECDYRADKKAQEDQAAAMKRRIDDMERQSAEQLAATCNEALEKMEGRLFAKDSPCVGQKKEFCRRLGTLDGYRRMLAAIPPSAANSPGYSTKEQAANCGLDDKVLRGKHCDSAVAAGDFAFVAAYCPDDTGALCAQAEEKEEYAYLFEHCPAEKAAFVAANCAGRKNSSQIEKRYRDLCVAEMGPAAFRNDGSAIPQTPADAVEQGVKQGVKGLKGMFGL